MFAQWRGNFRFMAEFLSAEPYGSGHINDTYCVVFDQAGTTIRYILQRINHNIFKQPALLMENIQRVTSASGLKAGGRTGFQPARADADSDAGGRFSYHHDEQGNYWRAYLFIEKARSYDAVENPRQAFEAAKAYGQFSKTARGSCRRRDCTTRSRIFITRQNDLPR